MLTYLFSTHIGTPGKTVGTMFAPVPVEITSYEPEKVGGNISLQKHCWQSKLGKSLHVLLEIIQPADKEEKSSFSKKWTSPKTFNIHKGYLGYFGFIDISLTHLIYLIYM